MIWFLLGIYEILPVFTTQLQYFSNYIQTVAVAQFYHNNNYLAHKTNKGPEKKSEHSSENFHGGVLF